jgi:adhesin/invasin
LVSGDLQAAVVGQRLSDPLVVRVVDEAGRPVPGQDVSFRVMKGGGSVFVEGTTTNPQGIAQNQWTLGLSAADSQVVEVRALTLAGNTLVSPSFRATAVAGSVTQVEALSVPSVVQAGSAPHTLSLRARDAFGNPAAGVAVTWTIGAGDGTLSAAQTSADAEGIAVVSWTPPTVPGPSVVSASMPGGASSTLTIDVTAGPPSVLLIESGDDQAAPTGSTLRVVALVRDAFANPVPGVAPTVTAITGGGSGAAVGLTDAEGRVAVHLVLGTIGTNTFRLAAGSAAATVSATSRMRVSFLTPAVNEVIPATLFVSVHVAATAAVASATARIGATNYPMVITSPTQTSYWQVEIPVGAVPRDTTLIEVTATDANGETGTATRSFIKDALPTITILSPQDNAIAAPSIRIQATCADDDPAGCAKMSLFADGVCGRFCGSTFGFEVSGGVIDTVVTFPQAQTDRAWRLTISGFDSRNQKGSRSVSIVVAHASPESASDVRNREPR